jgi:hypothetical protein
MPYDLGERKRGDTVGIVLPTSTNLVLKLYPKGNRERGPGVSQKPLIRVKRETYCLPPAALDICAIHAVARFSISAGATSSTCCARPQECPKGSRTLA